MSNVLPEMNAVALFAVNKDLKMVVEDHYQEAKFSALMRPVWSYLHHRHFIGNRRKLFAHFHDGRMEVFSFERNRFIFANSFDAKHTKDVVYFILSCGSNWRSTNRKTSYTYRDRSDRRMSCSMPCASTWRR